MTAAAIAHQLSRWRKSGNGFTACCPAHEDKTPSLSLRDGNDGRVLVHCHGGCEQSEVIEALRALGLWPERQQSARTPEDRRRWAEERAAMLRDLPEARYWRRSAMQMAEEGLANLKAALFDATQPQPDTDEIFRLTQQLARWNRLDDAALVEEYRSRRTREPGLTSALVRAAREREKSEALALCRYFGFSPSIADRALSQLAGAQG